MHDEPVAYFITFSTYGTRLHGDSRGSVFENKGVKKIIGQDQQLHNYKSSIMKYPQVNFEKPQRKIVLETISKHCQIKNWHLFAVHIRRDHVHVLLKSDLQPEKVLNEIKAWSTRKLREAGSDLEKVWTRHGSTQYIFTFEKLKEKVKYIILEQGKMMEYYIDEQFAEFLQ
jgi:REP element-mobilizing transposase RayT